MRLYRIGVSAPDRPIERYDWVTPDRWPAALALLRPVADLLGLERVELVTRDTRLVIHVVEFPDDAAATAPAGVHAPVRL